MYNDKIVDARHRQARFVFRALQYVEVYEPHDRCSPEYKACDSGGCKLFILIYDGLTQAACEQATTDLG